MLGLHNIFLIAPPPPQPPPSNNPDYNNTALTESSFWGPKKNTQNPDFFRKDAFFNVIEGDHGGIKVCIDCGNRAKKECQFSRCRTCCKNRGYNCVTHVKSTWIPASRRRVRKAVGEADDGGGSSESSSYGGKRPRLDATKQSNFEASSHPQEASFKGSMPGKVRAPAVFRCIRVTAITDGEAEVGYQATVNISGHVFKGLLYDHGIDEKNLFPKLNLESSSSGKEREKDSSSFPVHLRPPETNADPEN